MTEQKKTRRQMLEEFVARKPDHVFSRYALAIEYMNAGDSEAAEDHFRELLRRDSSYVPAYLIYAQFLARESRAAEARTVLNRGIAAATQANNSHALSEMQSLLSTLAQ